MLVQTVNHNNIKKIKDKYDKKMLEQFKNKIKIIQNGNQYIYGFYNGNTFEIIRINTTNIEILSFLRDNYENLIINIPITDKKNY